MSDLSSLISCLRVKSELTKIKQILGAPLQGTQLTLPTNIRVGWKGHPGHKLIAGSKFYLIGTWSVGGSTFSDSFLPPWETWQRSSLAATFSSEIWKCICDYLKKDSFVTPWAFLIVPKLVKHFPSWQGTLVLNYPKLKIILVSFLHWTNQPWTDSSRNYFEYPRTTEISQKTKNVVN